MTWTRIHWFLQAGWIACSRCWSLRWSSKTVKDLRDCRSWHNRKSHQINFLKISTEFSASHFTLISNSPTGPFLKSWSALETKTPPECSVNCSCLYLLTKSRKICHTCWPSRRLMHTVDQRRLSVGPMTSAWWCSQFYQLIDWSNRWLSHHRNRSVRIRHPLFSEVGSLSYPQGFSRSFPTLFGLGTLGVWAVQFYLRKVHRSLIGQIHSGLRFFWSVRKSLRRLLDPHCGCFLRSTWWSNIRSSRLSMRAC